MMQGVEIVDQLWTDERPFALYKLPRSSSAHLLLGSSSSIERYCSVSDLPVKGGFVMAPFSPSDATPMIVLTPQEEHILPLTLSKESTKKGEEEPCLAPMSEDYSEQFSHYITAIKEGIAEKLVLARRRTQPLHGHTTPSAVWQEATMLYPDAYVYLFYSKDTGLWMGASPEVLLSGKGAEWSTMALAGTQPLHDGVLPSVWSEKNRAEQAYVATYIRNICSAMKLEARESLPHSVQAGTMAHLKTDFSFRLSAYEQLPRLLDALHPTPAVCGFPKGAAQAFIGAQKQDERSYYSGFLGRIDPEGQTDIYVNIRCMQWQGQEVTLYAGGGLVASSQEEEEWVETERKMHTMARLVDATTDRSQ